MYRFRPRNVGHANIGTTKFVFGPRAKRHSDAHDRHIANGAPRYALHPVPQRSMSRPRHSSGDLWPGQEFGNRD